MVYQPPAVQREVIYPNGKYVLYGDGVNQPYEWVWIPAAPPPRRRHRRTSGRTLLGIKVRT